MEKQVLNRSIHKIGLVLSVLMAVTFVSDRTYGKSLDVRLEEDYYFSTKSVWDGGFGASVQVLNWLDDQIGIGIHAGIMTWDVDRTSVGIDGDVQFFPMGFSLYYDTEFTWDMSVALYTGLQYHSVSSVNLVIPQSTAIPDVEGASSGRVGFELKWYPIDNIAFMGGAGYQYNLRNARFTLQGQKIMEASMECFYGRLGIGLFF